MGFILNKVIFIIAKVLGKSLFGTLATNIKSHFKHYLSSALKYIPFYNSTYPGSIYLFEVSNGNIGTTCEICSKSTT